jgi:hypothetical protein
MVRFLMDFGDRQSPDAASGSLGGVMTRRYRAIALALLVAPSIAAIAAAVTALTLIPDRAEAAIKCKGRYQIVRGEELSTPYCNDNYLAAVAREYGSRHSAAAVRNNPNVKREVCRFVGHDTRVQDLCVGETLNGRGGFRF